MLSHFWWVYSWYTVAWLHALLPATWSTRWLRRHLLGINARSSHLSSHHSHDFLLFETSASTKSFAHSPTLKMSYNQQPVYGQQPGYYPPNQGYGAPPPPQQYGGYPPPQPVRAYFFSTSRQINSPTIIASCERAGSTDRWDHVMVIKEELSTIIVRLFRCILVAELSNADWTAKRLSQASRFLWSHVNGLENRHI